MVAEDVSKLGKDLDLGLVVTREHEDRGSTRRWVGSWEEERSGDSGPGRPA